ncbi:MAG: hypothetical protein ABI836_00705 [Gemmatimonadota bacterium]
MRNVLLVFIAVTAVQGCDHSQPFDSPPRTPLGPWSSGSIRRLTFNPGDDRTPSWLPDGSGIIYSSEREDRRDHDRCLNILPPLGGTVMQSICPTNPNQDDSTNLLESPAVSPEGRIFYHEVTSWIGQQKLGSTGLRLGLATDPVNANQVLQLPYTAPDGQIHSSIRSPAWTGPNTLVYLAELLFYEGSTFLPDTFFTGLAVVQLDVSGDTPVLQLVPGTNDASSAAVPEGPGVIYYTIGGDSVVYRRDLVAGTVTSVHNFGSGNIARDVTVRGNHLVAVVGRSVVWQYELDHSRYIQRDEGGDLHFLNLQTGQETIFATDTTLFRHPVLSPGGAWAVVEASPFALPHIAPQSDYTALNHRDDLWLFKVP